MTSDFISTGLYNIPGLGEIEVRIVANSRSVKARWKGGRVYVTAPAGLTKAELVRYVQGMTNIIVEKKPDNLYHIGQHFDFCGFAVNIIQQTHSPDKIIMNFRNGVGYIQVGRNWDIQSPNTIRNVSSCMCRIARSMAPDALIPRAKEIASLLGRHPLSWTISNGHRTLGHCNSRGIIALSYVLALYPALLRDYVICHEIAHLSEMNHSPRFHELADNYIRRISGRAENEIIAELKNYQVPIVK